MGSDESVHPSARLEVLRSLQEAETELKSFSNLSLEGRGRLRSFLLTSRLLGSG